MVLKQHTPLLTPAPHWDDPDGWQLDAAIGFGVTTVSTDNFYSTNSGVGSPADEVTAQKAIFALNFSRAD